MSVPLVPRGDADNLRMAFFWQLEMSLHPLKHLPREQLERRVREMEGIAQAALRGERFPGQDENVPVPGLERP